MKVDSASNGNSSENKNDLIFLDDNAIQRCGKNNIVNGRFIIDKSKPLNAFSNHFCKAYSANDIQNSNRSGYYAKIFEKPFLYNVDAIKNLISTPAGNFINPIAIGIVEFHDNGDEYVAVIFDDISAVSLGELIDKNESFSDKYIIRNILYNVKEALKNLHDLGIAHGSVNLDNIYLTKSGGFALDECFSTPFGHGQSTLYEPLSVAKISPNARGHSNYSADYYALGAVCLELTNGKRLKSQTVEILNNERMCNGSYRYYTNNQLLTGTINKIIQGLLNDDDNERFGYEELSNIPLLKDFFLASKEADFVEPIYFNGKKIYYSKVLAHEMICNFGGANDLFFTGKLQKFLSKSYKDLKSLNKIKFLLNENLITESFEPKNCTLNELALAEIIRILGFSNIFALKDISFSFDNYSISNLVLFLINNNEFLKLRLLSEMIEYQCLINPDKFKSNNEESNFFAIYMERLVINRSDYLFNFLYTLNKIFAYLPYLQPLQKRKLLFSAKDVVCFIERNNIPEKFLFDNVFLAPFLCSKLEDNIFKSSINSAMKSIHSVKMLLLFNEVQKIYKIEKLPYIAGIFSINIIESIGKFIQSKTIKNDLINKLGDIANEGDLGKIIEFLQNSDLLQNDKETFKNSVIKTKNIHKKLNDIIMELESKEYMQQKSMNTTLTISYLLFSVAVIYLLAILSI
jgi:serine/threonine protein kinase